MASKIVKTIAFPDDIWRQIKGFLLIEKLVCSSYCCKKIGDANYRLVKEIDDKTTLISKTGGISDICYYIKGNNLKPYSNFEEHFGFSVPYPEKSWYCGKCWSEKMFRPYDIYFKIKEYAGLTYSKEDVKKTEKLCLNLVGKNMFEKPHLKKTREDYKNYIRFMEEHLIEQYKKDWKKFQIETTEFKTEEKRLFKYYTKEIYASKVRHLFKELELYLISIDTKKGKLSSSQFAILMKTGAPYISYSNRYRAAFNKDLYD